MCEGNFNYLAKIKIYFIDIDKQLNTLIFKRDYLLANTLKHAVGRLRPCNNPSMHVNLLLKHCGSGFSFVSAHACNHFAIAGISTIILRLYSKKWVPIAYLWAAIISFAQVYVGVHFPIDILCGASLGILTGWFSTTYIYPYLSSKILK
ncbi:MAG: phosphatase PAP2 family protein [Bacteroidetes bacterium]|nr:phosphatase PAP2 family protein [Bacteroidota bacterium]